MKKKLVARVVALVIICVTLSIPVFAAREIQNFYFSTVTYDWGGGNTNWIIKKNESSAVINTLSSAGGLVSPSQAFNTRLRMWDHGPSYIVGHRWNCAPNSRVYVYYDYNNMTGWGVRAEFSLRVVGASAIMDGSWSADAY